MTIKLLVADDHEVVRRGLKSMFLESDIKIVADAASGEGLVQLIAKHKPDLVLLDVRMPDGDGLITLSRIKLHKPTQAVLMFSAFENPTYVARSVALGAAGYILKGIRKAKLIDVIHKVARGETLWTRDVLRRVSGSLATPRLNADVEAPLTFRESEVLAQMALGSTNKEIAQALKISYETVKEHVQHILLKIGVADRTQAALWSVRKGLA